MQNLLLYHSDSQGFCTHHFIVEAHEGLIVCGRQLQLRLLATFPPYCLTGASELTPYWNKHRLFYSKPFVYFTYTVTLRTKKPTNLQTNGLTPSQFVAFPVAVNLLPAYWCQPEGNLLGEPKENAEVERHGYERNVWKDVQEEKWSLNLLMSLLCLLY